MTHAFRRENVEPPPRSTRLAYMMRIVALLGGKSDGLVIVAEALQDEIEDARRIEAFADVLELVSQLEYLGRILFWYFCLYLTYGRWASTCSVTNLTYCNVSILPVVTKYLPISPRFSPFLIAIAMQVQHSYNSSTNG